MDILNERFKVVRETLNLKQNEFAKALGLTPSYISSIEKGRKEVTIKMVKLLIELFQVNPTWLLSGESENIFTIGKQKSPSKILFDVHLNENDKIGKLKSQRENEKQKLAEEVVASENQLEKKKVDNEVEELYEWGASFGNPRMITRREGDLMVLASEYDRKVNDINKELATAQGTFLIFSSVTEKLDKLAAGLRDKLYYRADEIFSKFVDKKAKKSAVFKEMDAFVEELAPLEKCIFEIEKAVESLCGEVWQQFPELRPLIENTVLEQEWFSLNIDEDGNEIEGEPKE